MKFTCKTCGKSINLPYEGDEDKRPHYCPYCNGYIEASGVIGTAEKITQNPHLQEGVQKWLASSSGQQTMEKAGQKIMEAISKLIR